MHDTGGVRGRHAVGGLHGDIQQRPHGNRTAFDQRGQRLARDDLRGDVEDAAVMTNVVDAENIRVVQRRGGVGFLLEPRAPSGVGRDIGGQDLDRHVTPQPRVTCPIDFPMPPAPSGETSSYGPSRVPGTRLIVRECADNTAGSTPNQREFTGCCSALVNNHRRGTNRVRRALARRWLKWIQETVANGSPFISSFRINRVSTHPIAEERVTTSGCVHFDTCGMIT